MPKIILTQATGAETDAAPMQAAVAAARLFDSHIVGLHARVDAQHELVKLASADMGMGAGFDGLLASMEQEAARIEEKAETAWRALCDGNHLIVADRPGAAGVSAEWATETGDRADWLAEYGRSADLIVVGRGGGDNLDSIESALMDTGKPVLIAAEHGAHRLDGIMAIAWKNTREAAGAVSAAMPFIEKASQVWILCVEEDSDEPDESSLRLANRLRWRNPNVAIKRAPRSGRDPVDVLMEAIDVVGAELLVMGGYGHTRVREAVFGGFTRAILEQASVPVLMAH